MACTLTTKKKTANNPERKSECKDHSTTLRLLRVSTMEIDHIESKIFLRSVAFDVIAICCVFIQYPDQRSHVFI